MHSIFNDAWQYGVTPRLMNVGASVDCSHFVGLGSCFARNLKRWLIHHDICTRSPAWGILYNPFSVRREVERWIDRDAWKAHVLRASGDGSHVEYIDPWRSWLGYSRRSALEHANAQFDEEVQSYLRHAQVMFVTLGLSEVWCRRDDQSHVLNRVPLSCPELHTGAWMQRLATPDEVARELSIVVETMHTHLPKVSIFFTISPVPLKYTASGLTIREANNISKATLILAVHDVIARYADVRYFPSYEIVQALFESGGDVWQQDGRHVTAQVVDHVCRQFISTYTEHVVEDDLSFWVPRVNKGGRIVGKLYCEGATDETYG